MKNNTTCDICGVTVKPRGLGAHKRLKHQIVERVILKEKINSSTQAKKTGGNISTQVDNSSQLSGDIISQVTNSSQLKSTQINKSITQEKRPSDYIKQNEKLIKMVAMPCKDLFGYPQFATKEEEDNYIMNELYRTAKLMNQTVDEYIIGLKERLKTAHPAIKRQYGL
jgi:hypothetical protein